MKRTSKWTAQLTWSLLLVLAGIIVIGLFTPPGLRLWAWLTIMVLLALFSIIAGYGITGLWWGVLIDDRNKMSLSRFQMVLWTILVLSAILTAALFNVALGLTDPIAISIPRELWLVMGISTTTMVGSPLILGTKRTREPDEMEAARAFDRIITDLGVDPNALDTKGQVIVNTDPKQARWSDMFRGEEVANGGQLDLGKIQMFYFTIILVLAYGSALSSLFANVTSGITAFPALDTSMIALLGISHAGYLTSKAIPRD